MRGVGVVRGVQRPRIWTRKFCFYSAISFLHEKRKKRCGGRGRGAACNVPESEFLKQRTGCSAPEFLRWQTDQVSFQRWGDRRTRYMYPFSVTHSQVTDRPDIFSHIFVTLTDTHTDGHDNALLIIYKYLVSFPSGYAVRPPPLQNITRHGIRGAIAVR